MTNAIASSAAPTLDPRANDPAKVEQYVEELANSVSAARSKLQQDVDDYIRSNNPPEIAENETRHNCIAGGGLLGAGSLFLGLASIQSASRSGAVLSLLGMAAGVGLLGYGLLAQHEDPKRVERFHNRDLPQEFWDRDAKIAGDESQLSHLGTTNNYPVGRMDSVAEALTTYMHIFDKDHSGAIDYTRSATTIEHDERVCNAMVGIASSYSIMDLTPMFHAMDSDKDGRVTKHELAVFASDHKQGTPAADYNPITEGGVDRFRPVHDYEEFLAQQPKS